MKTKWNEAFKKAFLQLIDAVEKLQEQTSPKTPLPRPRFFEIAQGITWPAKCCGGRVEWTHVYIEFPKVFDTHFYRLFRDDKLLFVNALAKEVKEKTEEKPRLMLRALRRIQAAAEWCRRRAEGRKRAAQEIMRQQKRFADTLDAEETLAKLAK